MTSDLITVFGQTVNTGGWQYFEAGLIVLIGLLLVSSLGRRMSTSTDRDWLQRFVVWAFLAKVAGSLARYWMVTVLYQSGDSYGYQEAGETFATVWRDLVIPVSDAGGEGTAFTEVITGFVYAVYTPTFLGGFLIFATLSFLGQLLFYAAFRRWFGARKQKLYGMAVLFFPSLVFWPSSIGKDALMVLFLGVAAYGASLLLHSYKLVAIPIVAVGLALASGVRPHVAGMFALALVLGLLLGKPLPHLKGSPTRPLLLLLAVGAAVIVLTTVSTTFEVSVEQTQGTSDISGFLEDVSARTGQGGSEIDGIAVTSLSRLPLAILTVLFRPLIHEGANVQIVASALEGTFLLGLVIWKLPQMWRNKGLLRRKAYLTMSLFYTGGFIIGFSAILNLGLLARQRVQLLPFFLALVVALGWPEPEKPETPDGLESAGPRPARIPEYASVGTGDPVTAQPTAPDTDTRVGSPIAWSEPEVEEPQPKAPDRTEHVEEDQAEEKQTKKKRETRRSPVRDRIRPEVVKLRSEDPEMSMREMARRVDASASTVRRVLVEEGLK